jgi:hypothetical protein
MFQFHLVSIYLSKSLVDLNTLFVNIFWVFFFFLFENPILIYCKCKNKFKCFVLWIVNIFVLISNMKKKIEEENFTKMANKFKTWSPLVKSIYYHLVIIELNYKFESLFNKYLLYNEATNF